MRLNPVLYLGEVILLSLLYFASAKLGLSIDAVSNFATLVWIPSGISFAALVLFGYRLWPGIFLGAFLVNYVTGAPLFSAVGIGIGNTLEALVGVYFFKRLSVHTAFDHLSDVVKFLIITPLAAGISAVIGVTSLYLAGTVTPALIYLTWQSWWIGDMISLIILTPFILVWSSTHYRTLTLKQLLEAFLFTAFVFIICTITFKGVLTTTLPIYSLRYIVYLPILWAALRLGQQGATTTILILSVFAVVETILGYGPFPQGTLNQRLLLLQTFMGIIAITSLLLAAVETERRNLLKRKDDFIGLASHELKTPLTSIKAFTELGQKYVARKDTEKAGRALNNLDNQINKLERLINDLLDISRINAGKLTFRKESLSFQELVISTVEAIQASTKTHTISIKNQIKHDTPMIYGDKDRLTQVLINLLTNAIKYSPDKKKIVVTIRSDKQQAFVSVRDYGIGITPEQREKLFQIYYRAHGNDQNSFPGLGMGLYLANSIVTEHKGKLWAESEGRDKSLPAGRQGSTFYLSLPLTKE